MEGYLNMSKSPNYMKLKDDELKELIKSNGLEEKDYTQENGSINRMMLNNVLKAIDMAVGKVKEVLVDSPGEPIKEINPRNKIAKGLSGMMVNITFYSSDENDLPYVQMALNGLALMVPREVPCWIPKEFVDGVLAHAIITKSKMDVSPDGKIRYIPKQVPRCQYTVGDIKHIDVLKKEYDEQKKK
jgi:hypothetical protein